MSSDLSHLLGKREIFWGLQEIAKENRRILEHCAFFDWMCTNYIAAASIGVRTFTDQSQNVRSLWRLLYEILEHPGVLSRHAHQDLYHVTLRVTELDMANATFDNVVGKRRAFLPQAHVKRDLRELEDVSHRVRKFVNKRIAHRTSPAKLRRPPEFDELDESMDTIDRIFCKYNLLLTASGMTSAFAARQYNWMEALHEAWVPIGSKFRPDA